MVRKSGLQWELDSSRPWFPPDWRAGEAMNDVVGAADSAAAQMCYLPSLGSTHK